MRGKLTGSTLFKMETAHNTLYIDASTRSTPSSRHHGRIDLTLASSRPEITARRKATRAARRWTICSVALAVLALWDVLA